MDDKDQTQRQPEVERLYRTNREQLFRFLWRVRPWFNTATAAETVHLYIYGRIAKIFYRTLVPSTLVAHAVALAMSAYGHSATIPGIVPIYRDAIRPAGVSWGQEPASAGRASKIHDRDVATGSLYPRGFWQPSTTA